MNDTLVETIRNDRYPSLSDCWETDTKNLFYIGAAMAVKDRQSASGFIHGFRYNIRTLHNILENRLFSTPLPHQTIADRQLQAIADKIIGEFSTFNCYTEILKPENHFGQISVTLIDIVPGNLA